MALDLNDYGPNGYHLTNSGVVDYTANTPFAASTNAIDLESGESDYAVRTTDAMGITGGTITLEGWINPESLPTSGNLANLIHHGDAGTDVEEYIRLFNDAGTQKIQFVRLRQNTSEDAATFTTTLSLGTWYHVAVTYDGSNVRGYLDGSLVAGPTASSGSGASAGVTGFWIGSNQGGSRFFDGQIDEVRVWNDERTVTEISNFKDRELNGDEAGLVAYYPFESNLASPSLSPSSSSSPSASPTPSPSLSPSASLSPSSSASKSSSPSLSPSSSASKSQSPSASPSTGYTGYTRGNYAVLPTNDDDLETVYSAQDVIDVATSDDVRVGQTAVLEFMVHQYKNFVGSKNNGTPYWEGQTNLAPSASTVNLQIYNRNTTTWETIDSDNTTAVNTDFILSASVSDFTDYKNASNVISCRIYQQAI